MGENNKAVPRHVAIILDGNGRWAKKRMLPRNAGHAAGSKNVEKICEAAWNMGIEYVTMYAFSKENWSRPQEELEEVSASNTGLHFQVALNYGGRDELRRAVHNMVQDAENGSLHAEEVTEEKIAEYLDTKGIPDPDLMIRTSGEQRLSNYLLWQLAYAEFYFTDTLWPDFNKKELEKAVEFFQSRDRRFGGI